MPEQQVDEGQQVHIRRLPRRPFTRQTPRSNQILARSSVVSLILLLLIVVYVSSASANLWINVPDTAKPTGGNGFPTPFLISFGISLLGLCLGWIVRGYFIKRKRSLNEPTSVLFDEAPDARSKLSFYSRLYNSLCMWQNPKT